LNHDTISINTPGCTNPPDYKKSTAFLNSAALLTLLQTNAIYKIAAIQDQTKTLGTPNGNEMQTQKTIELLLPKLPQPARKGYTVPHLTNNLVSVAELCDAGCTVFFHMHGVDINSEGVTIGQGWRDKPSRLWRIPLTSEGDEKISPPCDPADVDLASDGIYSMQANSIYECESKEQLVKYYHASFCSHPKTSLIAAADAGYL